MLRVEAHFEGKPELVYAVETVLHDWLDLPFSLHHVPDTNAVTLTDGARRLVVDGTYFRDKEVSALLPTLPLQEFDAHILGVEPELVAPRLPVLFGTPHYVREGDHIGLGIDIFGSVYFMLSRVEEVLVGTRDTFDRFPGHASIAAQAGFLERPIVDEYVEILWASMCWLWPTLQRRTETFHIELSCDVDHPYSPSRSSLKGMLRRAGASVLKDRSLAAAASHVVNFAQGAAGSGNFAYDHCWSAVGWMMDTAERSGNGPITFYVKAGASHPVHDRPYLLDEPVVSAMLKRIAERGHRIGLHPSFETYRDADLIAVEADRLRQTLECLGIDQPEGLGARQHFLRWATPLTAQSYEAAGLAHDSSLTFADLPGFRCGTSRHFPLFDVSQRRKLAVIERPLVVMEDSVQYYMGAGRHSEAAFEHMMRLKGVCRRMRGSFSLLWHNSNILTPADKRHYTALVA